MTFSFAPASEPGRREKRLARDAENAGHQHAWQALLTKRPARTDACDTKQPVRYEDLGTNQQLQANRRAATPLN